MDIDPKEAAYRFEAVKTALRQDKNGHTLILSIHPNEVPRDLYTDPLGSRYVVAMVRLNDQDEPVMPEEVAEGEAAVTRAGMLCRNSIFQQWMISTYGDILDRVVVANSARSPEDICVAMLHDALNIVSRAELRTNPVARRALALMMRRFEQDALKGRKEG